jgi:hypothetical protein
VPERTLLARGIAVLLLCVAGTLTGCTPHPVGPARTYGKYEGKAATTAASALSAVETTRMIADAASRGNAFGPFTGVVVSDAEEAVSGLSGTFGSIQPPDARADQLRDELEQLLGDALDHVTKVRIAARRGDLSHLKTIAAPLDDDAKKLGDFAEAHG